jgi:hypothetical protein
MKKLLLIGLLFIIGCANDRNENTAIERDSNQAVNAPAGSAAKEFGQIRIIETSSPARGKYLQVEQFAGIRPNHSQCERLTGKSGWVVVGWISRSPEAVYRYYEPAANELTATFTEEEVEVLKSKIHEHLTKCLH